MGWKCGSRSIVLVLQVQCPEFKPKYHQKKKKKKKEGTGCTGCRFYILSRNYN
jgi:hypothetical protein